MRTIKCRRFDFDGGPDVTAPGRDMAVSDRPEIFAQPEISAGDLIDGANSIGQSRERYGAERLPFKTFWGNIGSVGSSALMSDATRDKRGAQQRSFRHDYHQALAVHAEAPKLV